MQLFRIQPLGAKSGPKIEPGIGAEITGLDVAGAISDETFGAIEDAFNRYAVVVIRDQNPSREEFAAFSKRFGAPQVNVRQKVKFVDFQERIRSEIPEVSLISNVIENGKPVGSQDAGRYWHSDLCYLQRPSKATLLHALEVPEKDGVVLGATRFADVAAAYDALSEELKTRLDGLTAANSFRAMWKRKAVDFGKRQLLSDDELSAYPEDAVHPIARTHPITGRKCLFVCDGYTSHIVGLAEQESDELLENLYAHIVKRGFQYRHEWRQGDLLMWDNCTVQHKASFDYALPQRRMMQRCTIEGSVPY
jgi:taurine dioxygenase